MPRNPKATRPNAKTAGATMSVSSPVVLTECAMTISTTTVMPDQPERADNPAHQLQLHGGRRHRQQDERDQGHAGDAVRLKAVRARADRVAGVVTRAVRDDAGITRVVLLDVEDNLHEVGPDVRDLRENASGDPEGGGAERLADREADEARPCVIPWDEEQDAEHQEQLDADEQHADAHPSLERDRVQGERLALEGGERSARVRERVDPHPEPGHAVAPADPDEAEEQDDQHLHRLELQQHAEIEDDDDPDERLEDQEELSLCDQ